MNSLVDSALGAAPRFSLQDFAPVQESFEDAVVHGLSLPQKSIPARFLYDEAGSRLFDRICELPEYYPTRNRAEDPHRQGRRDRRRHRAGHRAPGVRGRLKPEGAPAAGRPGPRPPPYEPIDVSREHLVQLAEEIAAAYPGLAVRAICADYTQPLDLPDSETRRRRGGPSFPVPPSAI